MLKLCMRDYKIYGVYEIDHGSYTVNGRTCVEAQINGVVPRVFLSTMEIDNGQEFEEDWSDEATKTNEEVPRSLKRKLDTSETYNGENVVGKRQRKPNTKFSDYIIPSNFNIVDDEQDNDDSAYEQDEITEEPKVKVMKTYNDVKRPVGRPKIHRPRIKERILSNSDDEPSPDTGITEDPLDLGNDDVVHSFLPLVEPDVLDVKDDDSEVENGSSKPSDNDTDSGLNTTPVPVQPIQNVVAQNLVLSPNWQSGDGQQSLYGKVLCMPLVFTGNSQNAVINVNDIAEQQLMLLNTIDQRWVHIKPKLPGVMNQSVTPNDKRKEAPKKNSVYKQVVTPKTYTAKYGKMLYESNISDEEYTPKPKPDIKSKPKTEVKSKTGKLLSNSRYILLDSDIKYKPPKISDIDFNKLVRSLKAVKLPTKNWKIRIIVSPQETITEVIFTNKESIERCVKFARAIPANYKVTFGKSEVKLLGAPTLQTFDDIAVLLEIINTIQPNSHILEYC